jgi:two-component system, OmpR family, phosphate regulon sensor histidine kinase PhoR
MLRWRRPPREPGQAGVTGPSDRAGQPFDARQVLERLHEGLMLIESEGSVAWINGAAQELLHAPENAVGRPLLEVVRDHRIDALVRQALATGVEQAAEVTLSVSGRTLQARAVPLAGRDSCLILEETTRLRYLETVRQQFVANLSHELRTPLAGLDLAAQTLAGQLPGDGSAEIFMERILQESQRLNAILQNLTQLAALDAEEIQAERQAFPAAELLEENAARFAARAAAAGLILRVELADPSLRALGDRSRTDQALQSLVDNALKFTSAGEVVLSANSTGDMIEISVRDTGIGIPPADLPRIFERFYKVDRARGGQPGTGLGLSIARHLVELQGGTLVAESAPGAGTVMRIRLPRPLFAQP